MFEAFSIYGKIALQGMGLLNKELSGLQQKVKQVGMGMQSAGRKMTMGLTLPLVGLGAASFKMAGDFDQNMRAVNVMLGASEDEMVDYKKAVLDMSTKTGKSAADVAKAFYVVVSAGHRGSDAIEILNTSLEGSVGGMADATMTTEAMAKAMEVFGLKGVPGASRAMDVFFGIVDSGLLTFEELATCFPRATAAAAGLGVTIEEAGAAMATLSKVSGSTEEASTALNAVFSQLIKPSKDLQALYEEWGVTTGPQAIEQFGGLKGVMEKVTEATGGNVDQMALLFPNLRAIRAILPLATTSADTFAEALEGMKDVTGRAGEAFGEMAQGPGYQWNVFMQTMKALMISIGDVVAKKIGPIFTKFTDKIKGLIKWTENLTNEQIDLYLKLGLIVAAAGPVLYVFGTMITTVNTLTGSFIAMRAAAKGALGPISIAIAVIATHYIATKKLSSYIENEYARSLLMNMTMIGSVTEAVNIWSLATKVAEEKQLSLFKVLFSKRSTVQEMSDEIDKQREYYNKVTIAATEYAGTFPEISQKLQDLINEYNKGTISQEAFNEGTGEIIKNTQEYIRYQRLLNEAIKGRDIIFYQEKIIALAETLGIATDESDDFAAIQKEVEEALGITEEAVDDLEESVDDLRSGFSKLLGVLFDGINANNNFEESGWALAEAEKEVTRLLGEGKKGTEEYEKSLNSVDKEMQTHIDMAFGVYTSTYTTREEQRNAKEEALKYGRQMVETGEWGEASYNQLKETFTESARGIQTEIDTTVLPAYLNMYVKGRELKEQKIDPEIEADTVQATEDIRTFSQRLAAIPDEIVTVTTRFINEFSGGRSGQAGYAAGGITPGGSVLVGEEGPEIAEFPAGTRIIPNNKIGSKNLTGQGITIQNFYNIAELAIREEADFDKVVEKMQEGQADTLRGKGFKEVMS